jgi:tyrosyl-tRNA synthetase
MPDLIDELSWRGLLSQCTDEEGLRAYLREGGAPVYCGFDPTAASLHLGNLVPIVALAHAQRHGLIPVVVMGGGTGMIGDPSGKDAERSLMTTEEIEANVAAQQAQLRRFFAGSGANAAIFRNNAQWIEPLTCVELLRDVGKHFSVNAMIAKESVKRRLDSREQGISYTEFSYMVLQAFDFLKLYEAHKCRIQLGGSDQWGNITAGIDLIRRVHGDEAYGLTLPLLTTATGEKFGKSAGNAIWLDPKMTSPFAMYQHLIRTDDRDVVKFLRYFTFLEREEIEDLAAVHEDSPELRQPQRALARELTRWIHGADEMRKAEKATEALYGGSLDELGDDELREIFADVPSVEVPTDRLAGDGLPLVDLLVESGVAKSKGAARRLIESGGAYVNNERAGDIALVLGTDALGGRKTLVLRSGKRNYTLVRFV